MGKPLDTCWWCKHKFKDGEMMGLAAVSGKLNKILCGSCIDTAEKGQTGAR